MVVKRCPVYMALLSVVQTKFKRIQGITFGAGLAAGVSGRLTVLTANRLRSFTPGLCVQIYFHCFSYSNMTARQRGFKIRIFLPLHEVPSWVGLHIHETAVYEASVNRLRLFLTLKLGLIVRGYLKCMPRKHVEQIYVCKQYIHCMFQKLPQNEQVLNI